MSNYGALPKWKRMVMELCELDDGLKPNELDFIESLSKLSMSARLSDRQVHWLDAIYTRLIG